MYIEGTNTTGSVRHAGSGEPAWLWDTAQASVPVLGLHAGRAQTRPGSQMGVSFPAIQGGRDLRPPLRAPI